MIHMKVVKRVNSKFSSQGQKFSFLYLYDDGNYYCGNNFTMITYTVMYVNYLIKTEKN